MTEQLKQMAALSGWKPEALAGWSIGDRATVASLGRVEVAELLPPSMIAVRVASGAVVRVGWRALSRE